MEPNQAVEQLQTIRTLMERSAIYRRALAPIMTFCGLVGLAGGACGDLLPLHTSQRFVFYWAGMAALALLGSFWLVRRQALRDAEAFWSPPTRRVTQALVPALVVGAFAGAVMAWQNPYWYQCRFLVPVWCVLFGLGLHSAAFFVLRGLSLFAWIFIGIGTALGLVCVWGNSVNMAGFLQPHWLMGLTFGGLHLAYGVYLYFTEKRGNLS